MSIKRDEVVVKWALPSRGRSSLPRRETPSAFHPDHFFPRLGDESTEAFEERRARFICQLVELCEELESVGFYRCVKRDSTPGELSPARFDEIDEEHYIDGGGDA